jgi:hypothetical protein
MIIIQFELQQTYSVLTKSWIFKKNHPVFKGDSFKIEYFYIIELYLWHILNIIAEKKTIYFIKILNY